MSRICGERRNSGTSRFRQGRSWTDEFLPGLTEDGPAADAVEQRHFQILLRAFGDSGPWAAVSAVRLMFHIRLAWESAVPQTKPNRSGKAITTTAAQAP